MGINTDKVALKSDIVDNLTSKANVDASNISTENVTSWQQKLITSAIAGNGIKIENGVVSRIPLFKDYFVQLYSSAFKVTTQTSVGNLK